MKLWYDGGMVDKMNDGPEQRAEIIKRLEGMYLSRGDLASAQAMVEYGALSEKVVAGGFNSFDQVEKYMRTKHFESLVQKFQKKIPMWKKMGAALEDMLRKIKRSPKDEHGDVILRKDYTERFESFDDNLQHIYDRAVGTLRRDEKGRTLFVGGDTVRDTLNIELTKEQKQNRTELYKSISKFTEKGFQDWENLSIEAKQLTNREEINDFNTKVVTFMKDIKSKFNTFINPFGKMVDAGLITSDPTSEYGYKAFLNALGPFFSRSKFMMSSFFRMDFDIGKNGEHDEKATLGKPDWTNPNLKIGSKFQGSSTLMRQIYAFAEYKNPNGTYKWNKIMNDGINLSDATFISGGGPQAVEERRYRIGEKNAENLQKLVDKDSDGKFTIRESATGNGAGALEFLHSAKNKGILKNIETIYVTDMDVEGIKKAEKTLEPYLDKVNIVFGLSNGFKPGEVKEFRGGKFTGGIVKNLRPNIEMRLGIDDYASNEREYDVLRDKEVSGKKGVFEKLLKNIQPGGYMTTGIFKDTFPDKYFMQLAFNWRLDTTTKKKMEILLGGMEYTDPETEIVYIWDNIEVEELPPKSQSLKEVNPDNSQLIITARKIQKKAA